MKWFAIAAAAALFWGCGGSAPDREIVAAFRSFVAAVGTADTQKIEAIAPFLTALEPKQRDAAIRALVALGRGEPDTRVSRGGGDTWLLTLGPAGARTAAATIPFRRNERGRWEMSPVLESSARIDVVPARGK